MTPTEPILAEPPKGKVTEEERAAWARHWQSVGWSPPALPVLSDSLWIAAYRAGRSDGDAELARLRAELARLREERDKRTIAIIDMLWQHGVDYISMEESATRLIGLDCDWVYAHWDDRDFPEQARALLAKLDLPKQESPVTPTEPTLTELRQKRDDAHLAWEDIFRAAEAAERAFDDADRALREREARK